MSKRHSVRVNLLLSEEAKTQYDSLPHGMRRAVLSSFMETYAKIHRDLGPLALHAILEGKYTIDLDLTDEARRVLDDATGDEKSTGARHIVSGDGRQGTKRVNRADKNKARGKAA